MKVLIAYDGMHPVENLVNDFKKAGLPKNTTVSVVTVVDAFLPPAGAMSLPESTINSIKASREAAQARIKNELATAKKGAAQVAKRIRASFPGWKVTAVAFGDFSPMWGIVKKADAWKPDLVVVGSHGASLVARFFLGSVARGVLIHARNSVRIVRAGRRLKGPARLLIGMDGSYDSQKAVQKLSQRVWPKGTLVRFVTGFDQNMASALAFHRVPLAKKSIYTKDLGEEGWIHQMTAPFAKKLERAGLNVSNVVKAGKPWKVLVKEAEKWKADCIFVGARGLGSIDRFLLGSVSSAVASRADCSVEVIR